MTELDKLADAGDESIITTSADKEYRWIIQLRPKLVILHDSATLETVFTTPDSSHINYYGTTFFSLRGRDHATLSWDGRLVHVRMTEETFQRYLQWHNAVEL
ncbi:MAG: hypothetical protein ACKOU6_15455 [Planctomycetota bacterium]